jgi:hypothetical protein
MAGRFDVYEVIDRIRRYPAMYLGQTSLIRLKAFLDGCFWVATEHALPTDDCPPFGELYDWVARRYGWYESTAGWCNIILQECGGDDAKALGRFFELIDEYRGTR